MFKKPKLREWDATKLYQDKQIAQEYDQIRFSSLAGQVFNNREKRIIAESFEHLPRETVVLDMPCGTGRLAEAILDTGLRVHGADISEQMLEVARGRLTKFGDRFTTEVIDAFAQAKVEPRFEATLCARVLMHFPLDEQIKFLRGVVANTRKRVVINHSFNSPYQRFRRWVKRMLKHQVPARYPITEDEIQQLLKQSGLVEVSRRRMNPFVSEAVYIVAEKA